MLAGDLTEGFSIPGLDNGYVIEVEKDSRVSIGQGSDYPYLCPEGYITVTMNDAEGNEFYLICPSDMRLTAKE